MPYTTLASWPLLIWKALESKDSDPRAVFTRAGIDPETLAKPGSRVSERRLERCWAEAATTCEAGCFGLQVANHWHPTTLHALGIACLSSHTLHDAFQRFVRFSMVVTDATEFRLEPVPGGHHFSWRFVDASVSDHQEEQHATLATVLLMARLCLGEALSPTALHLAHARTGCDEDLADFFHCPISHDQPYYGLTFASVDLDKPLPSANLDIVSSTEQVVAEYLAGLTRGDTVARARGEIMRQLPSGEITEESVAEALNLSLRTFQRRLRDQGMVYRGLLDEVRRDLAGKYLANPRYSITEISYLLGFSEPSSFARSFRRWNGTSPTAVRQAGG